jgi:uncharacterized protein YbaR (Trm112 family)
MIDAQLLNLLCCPESHQPLRLADDYLLQKLNQLIAAGHLKNRAGQTLKSMLDGALIREDRKILYPIVNKLPILLIEEGILLPAELNWSRP